MDIPVINSTIDVPVNRSDGSVDPDTTSSASSVSCTETTLTESLAQGTASNDNYPTLPINSPTKRIIPKIPSIDLGPNQMVVTLSPTANIIAKSNASNKRVIRKIIPIDPKKLQQAGLDRRIAEALSKQKSQQANSSKPLHIITKTIPTSPAAGKSSENEKNLQDEPLQAKTSVIAKTIIPPKITITAPDSPSEQDKQNLTGLNSHQRLLHVKTLLNRKLLQKKTTDNNDNVKISLHLKPEAPIKASSVSGSQERVVPMKLPFKQKETSSKTAQLYTELKEPEVSTPPLKTVKTKTLQKSLKNISKNLDIHIEADEISAQQQKTSHFKILKTDLIELPKAAIKTSCSISSEPEVLTPSLKPVKTKTLQKSPQDIARKLDFHPKTENISAQQQKTAYIKTSNTDLIEIPKAAVKISEVTQTHQQKNLDNKEIQKVSLNTNHTQQQSQSLHSNFPQNYAPSHQQDHRVNVPNVMSLENVALDAENLIPKATIKTCKPPNSNKQMQQQDNSLTKEAYKKISFSKVSNVNFNEIQNDSKKPGNNQQQHTYTSNTYKQLKPAEQKKTFPEVSPLKQPFPTVNVPKETPLPAIDSFKKPYPYYNRQSNDCPQMDYVTSNYESVVYPHQTTALENTLLNTSIPGNPLETHNDATTTANSLIVLENKVLSQDEMIDLTELRLSSTSTPRFINPHKPIPEVVIKQEQTDEYPVSNTITSTTLKQTSPIEVPKEITIPNNAFPNENVTLSPKPNRKIINIQKLNLPPEQLADLAKKIKERTTATKEPIGGNKLQDIRILNPKVANRKISTSNNEKLKAYVVPKNIESESCEIPQPSSKAKIHMKSLCLDSYKLDHGYQLTNSTADLRTLTEEPITSDNCKVVVKEEVTTRNISDKIQENTNHNANIQSSMEVSAYMDASLTSDYRKPAIEIVDEPVEAEDCFSAVDFITSLNSTHPITEDTSLEISPEELNLNASCAMNLSPLRIQSYPSQQNASTPTFKAYPQQIENNLYSGTISTIVIESSKGAETILTQENPYKYGSLHKLKVFKYLNKSDLQLKNPDQTTQISNQTPQPLIFEPLEEPQNIDLSQVIVDSKVNKMNIVFSDAKSTNRIETCMPTCKLVRNHPSPQKIVQEKIVKGSVNSNALESKTLEQAKQINENKEQNTSATSKEVEKITQNVTAIYSETVKNDKGLIKSDILYNKLNKETQRLVLNTEKLSKCDDTSLTNNSINLTETSKSLKSILKSSKTDDEQKNDKNKFTEQTNIEISNTTDELANATLTSKRISRFKKGKINLVQRNKASQGSIKSIMEVKKCENFKNSLVEATEQEIVNEKHSESNILPDVIHSESNILPDVIRSDQNKCEENKMNQQTKTCHAQPQYGQLAAEANQKQSCIITEYAKELKITQDGNNDTKLQRISEKTEICDKTKCSMPTEIVAEVNNISQDLQAAPHSNQKLSEEVNFNCNNKSSKNITSKVSVVTGDLTEKSEKRLEIHNTADILTPSIVTKPKETPPKASQDNTVKLDFSLNKIHDAPLQEKQDKCTISSLSRNDTEMPESSKKIKNSLQLNRSKSPQKNRQLNKDIAKKEYLEVELLSSQEHQVTKEISSEIASDKSNVKKSSKNFAELIKIEKNISTSKLSANKDYNFDKNSPNIFENKKHAKVSFIDVVKHSPEKLPEKEAVIPFSKKITDTSKSPEVKDRKEKEHQYQPELSSKEGEPSDIKLRKTKNDTCNLVSAEYSRRSSLRNSEREKISSPILKYPTKIKVHCQRPMSDDDIEFLPVEVNAKSKQDLKYKLLTSSETTLTSCDTSSRRTRLYSKPLEMELNKHLGTTLEKRIRYCSQTLDTSVSKTFDNLKSETSPRVPRPTNLEPLDTEESYHDSTQDSQILKPIKQRKKLRKTVEDIKKSQKVQTDSDSDNDNHYYDDCCLKDCEESNEFLGFEENTDTSQNIKNIRQNALNRDANNKADISKGGTPLKNWLTTGKAIAPTFGKKEETKQIRHDEKLATSPSSLVRGVVKDKIPFKKRWDLVANFSEGTDITDDTSPADDEEEIAVKEKTVIKNINKRGIRNVIDSDKALLDSKKIKLDDFQEKIAEHRFIKPRHSRSISKNPGVDLNYHEEKPKEGKKSQLDVKKLEENRTKSKRNVDTTIENSTENSGTDSDCCERKHSRQLRFQTKDVETDSVWHESKETSHGNIRDKRSKLKNINEKRYNKQKHSGNFANEFDSFESPTSSKRTSKRNPEDVYCHDETESTKLNIMADGERNAGDWNRGENKNTSRSKSDTVYDSSETRKSESKTDEDIILDISPKTTNFDSNKKKSRRSKSNTTTTSEFENISDISKRQNKTKKSCNSDIVKIKSLWNSIENQETKTENTELLTEMTLKEEDYVQTADTSSKEISNPKENSPGQVTECKRNLEKLSHALKTPKNSKKKKETKNKKNEVLIEKTTKNEKKVAAISLKRPLNISSSDDEILLPVTKKQKRNLNIDSDVDISTQLRDSTENSPDNLKSISITQLSLTKNETPISTSSACRRRKSKVNESNFNPRLLLITQREQLDTEEVLTETKPGTGPIQCGLCLGRTDKWTSHLAEHYGIGWQVGKEKLNIENRTVVLSHMNSYIKNTDSNGLNCRMCKKQYRSGFGLMNHIESCGVQTTRVVCEYCQKDYAKSSLPAHMRLCYAKVVAESQSADDSSGKKKQVFGNTGRLKRNSTIKAENKLKVLGAELEKVVSTAETPKAGRVDENQLSEDEEWSADDEKVNDDYNDNKKRGSKKQLAKKPYNRNQNQSTRKEVFDGRFTDLNKEVFNKWKNFLKSNYSSELLFGEFNTQYSIINEQDFHKYLPTQKVSMKFNFKRRQTFNVSFGVPEKNIEWSELKRYESIHDTSNTYFFLGAPIKFCSWLPLPDHVNEQYLALTYRQDMFKYVKFKQPKQHHTIILILKVTETNNKVELKVHYGFLVPDGPVHHVAFLPSGGYDEECNRLGLVAVATINSAIKVYSLPINVQTTPESTHCKEHINLIDVKSSFILNIDMSDIKQTKQHVLLNTQCLQICWSEFAGHQHIFASFSNGCIGIWDITNDPQQNLNRFVVDNIPNYAALNYFYVGEKCIKCFALHYDTCGPRWLAVSSAYRKFVIYDIKCFMQPVIMKEEANKNILLSMDWCPLWETLLYSFCDVIPSNGRCITTLNPTNLMFSQIKLDTMACSVTQIHYTPITNLCVASLSNGDVIFLNTKELHYECALGKKFGERRMLYSMDIKQLNGEPLVRLSSGNQKNDNVSVPSEWSMHDVDYKNKYGLVFLSILKLKENDKKVYLNENRCPPSNLLPFMRINTLRCNLNLNAKNLMALGYENGFLRLVNFNNSDIYN